MHSKLAALILPVLAAAYPQANAPSPDQITIKDTTYSGNGCPQGSVSTSTSVDRTVSLPPTPHSHPQRLQGHPNDHSLPLDPP
jgi:hypothetical protein